MKSIQILHSSLFGYFLSFYLHSYFKKKSPNTKIIQHHRIIYKYNSNVYFIIKSRFLTSEKMYSYLREIRFRSNYAKIIIVGNHINYEELFKNRYQVFGVIDTTKNKSLSFIKNKIQLYLDGLYELDQIENS